MPETMGFTERMAAKAAANRYFLELERIAAESQVEARKTRKMSRPTPKPEPAPKAKRHRAPSTKKPAWERLGADPAVMRSDGKPRARSLPLLGETAPCAGGCGRVLRPRSSTIEDFPGTVPINVKRMCSTCYRRMLGQQERTPMPSHCLGCGRALRSRRDEQLGTAPEGSLRHAGRGLCGPCAKKASTS